MIYKKVMHTTPKTLIYNCEHFKTGSTIRMLVSWKIISYLKICSHLIHKRKACNTQEIESKYEQNKELQPQIVVKIDNQATLTANYVYESVRSLAKINTRKPAV